MDQPRKLPTRKIVVMVLAVLITLGILFWALFAATFRCTLFTKDMGRCLSISLVGKWELRDVDKAVITHNGKTVSTTDLEFLSQLTKETQTATHGGDHGDESVKIQLYCGDKLVRTMYFSECCHTITVYETDATHWIFSWWILDHYESGYVFASNSLADQIYDLI